MEGVPRISMMSFPMRRSADKPNWKQKFKLFIRDHYNEDPESYSNEINELESLRAAAIHISKNVAGSTTLKKYFCQLNYLKSRFPLHEGESCAVSFSWYDIYSETVHGWSDVDFEMSCILYNIGAVHSELGTTDNRQSADGMKNACINFQCAAWAFQHLRHNYHKFFTPDMSPDTLSIMTNICLAQAQECILEKSLIDNKKSTITAKVALQIVDYYQLSMKTIDQMVKDSSQYSDKVIKAVKKWRKLAELKANYYKCLSLLYQGLQAEDDSKWGERVTFYKAALDKLTEAIKSAKAMEKTDNVHDTLQFTFDVVQGKVAISDRENEFIYHDKVPELGAVGSDIKGVSLVKGIAFKFDDSQISGPDIFVRLVPMEAHETSSLYSEEKAKVLRNYSSKIEEKNETLDRFLIALQLDQLDLHSTSKKVPQELVDCCAALSVNKMAVKKLSELMSKLSGIYHDVDGNLKEIHQLLEEEVLEEKDHQKIILKKSQSDVLNELFSELQKYEKANNVAAETNQTLHDTLTKHVSNLNILMKPFDEVLKHIPSLGDKGGMDEDAINQMKRLISKVDEMRKQRIMLEQQLRDSIHGDDITKQLVIKKDQDLETVFQEELKKHDKITQVLDQNLLAQENIMRALTEANANYAETRKSTVEIMKNRERVIGELLHSYEMYDELLGKCNNGIEFYTKLDTTVKKLLEKVHATCKSQREERERSLKSLIKKAPALSKPNDNIIPGSGAYSPFSSDVSSGGPPKLKDYLGMMKGGQSLPNTMGNLNMAQPQNDFSQQPYNTPTAPQQYYNQFDNPSNTSSIPTSVQYPPTGTTQYGNPYSSQPTSGTMNPQTGGQPVQNQYPQQYYQPQQPPTSYASNYNSSGGPAGQFQNVYPPQQQQFQPQAPPPSTNPPPQQYPYQTPSFQQPADYTPQGYAPGPNTSANYANQHQASDNVYESYLAKYVKQHQGYIVPPASSAGATGQSYSGYSSVPPGGLGTYQQPYATQPNPYGQPNHQHQQ